VNKDIFIISLFSFLFSFILTKLVIPYFSNFLNDVPNKRSSHIKLKPTSGGIIFSSVSIISSLFIGNFLPLFSLPIVITGFIDDLKGLKAFYRFVVQIFTSLFIIKFIGLYKILTLFIDNNILLVLSIFISSIFAAGIINLVNFMDGIDGLVAGCMTIIFFTFSIKHNINFLPITASLFGFLLLNWYPSKIFMGDVGSTFLGSLYVSILFKSQNIDDFIGLLLLSTPILFDGITCIITRFIKGKNIFAAHNSHLYQRLYQAGWNHALISFIYIGLTGFLSFVYLNFQINFLILPVLMVLIFGVYLNKNFAKSLT